MSRKNNIRNYLKNVIECKEEHRQIAIEKGITLVALVITVVIIIILAMVSINFLFGENGIVTKAQEAVKQTNIGNVREQLEMAKASAIAGGLGNTSIDDYFEILVEEEIIGNKESDTVDNGNGTMM